MCHEKREDMKNQRLLCSLGFSLTDWVEHCKRQFKILMLKSSSLYWLCKSLIHRAAAAAAPFPCFLSSPSIMHWLSSSHVTYLIHSDSLMTMEPLQPLHTVGCKDSSLSWTREVGRLFSSLICLPALPLRLLVGALVGSREAKRRYWICWSVGFVCFCTAGGCVCVPIDRWRFQTTAMANSSRFLMMRGAEASFFPSATSRRPPRGRTAKWAAGQRENVRKHWLFISATRRHTRTTSYPPELCSLSYVGIFLGRCLYLVCIPHDRADLTLRALV